MSGPIVALFIKEFRSYFFSPIGYIFVSLFIALTGLSVYFRDEFFIRNHTGLDLLTSWYPIIMAIFAPTITMSLWSDEKKSGTEELLFTLPVSDLQVVIAKYLSACTIYSIAVFFHFLTNITVLIFLGSPDAGVIFSSYIGYLFLGFSLLSVGLVASSLTSNATIAFILGAVLCGVLVFSSPGSWVSGLFGVFILVSVFSFIFRSIFSSFHIVIIASLLSFFCIFFVWMYFTYEPMNNFFGYLGILPYFVPFSSGEIPLHGLLYFTFLSAVMLYINSILLSRRHW